MLVVETLEGRTLLSQLGAGQVPLPTRAGEVFVVDDFNNKVTETDLGFNYFGGNTGATESVQGLTKLSASAESNGPAGGSLRFAFDFTTQPAEGPFAGFFSSLFGLTDTKLSLDGSGQEPATSTPFRDYFLDTRDIYRDFLPLPDRSVEQLRFDARLVAGGAVTLKVELKDEGGADVFTRIALSSPSWQTVSLALPGGFTGSVSGQAFDWRRVSLLSLIVERTNVGAGIYNPTSGEFLVDNLALADVDGAYPDLAAARDPAGGGLLPQYTEAFLDLVRASSFQYFLDSASTDPRTGGIIQDRSTFADLLTVGGVGFQLTSYVIGAERGYITRADASARVRAILTVLHDHQQGPARVGTIGHQGFFYHFLGIDGLRKQNFDFQETTGVNEALNTVELSTIDTALALAGVVTAGQYFGASDPTIRTLADDIYGRVDWRFMLYTNPNDPNDPQNDQFYLGWKPNEPRDDDSGRYGRFKLDDADHAGQYSSKLEDGVERPATLDYYTDEGLLIALLAMGSPDPTHRLDRRVWDALARDDGGGSFVRTFPGALFTYQFLSAWLDTQSLGTDSHPSRPLDFYTNTQAAILATRQHAVDNPNDRATWRDGGGATRWGLSAAEGPFDDYFAEGAPTAALAAFGQSLGPGGFVTRPLEVGTTTVYGVGSAIVHTPAEAIAGLWEGQQLGLLHPRFGFADAFNRDIADAAVPGLVDPSRLLRPAVAFEAEAGTGAGSVMQRGAASGARTVWLHAGESRTLTFTLKDPTLFESVVRYSNDGPSDLVQIQVDGTPIGQFITQHTRPPGGVPGSGWNNFFSSGPLGSVTIPAGTHTVTVVATQADPFGVEIDLVNLNPKPAGPWANFTGFAIDQGPMLILIDNYLGHQFAPGLFMSYPTIRGALATLFPGGSLPPVQQLRGIAFEDADGDGVRAPGEPLLQGRTVYLDANRNGRRDPGETSTTTDETGQYAFSGLLPGTHVVAEEAPAGWRRSYPRDLSWASPSALALGRSPETVAVGDLDRDGDTDLIVGNYASGIVSIRWNRGDGTFAPAADYAVGSEVEVVAVDLDRDGDLDLATPRVVLLNRGDGTFAPAASHGGSGVIHLEAGDLDGDGDVDLIVGRPSSLPNQDMVRVLLNHGNATFAAPINVAVGFSVNSIDLADLDGDGDLDLAVARDLGGTAVFWNGGNASFATTGGSYAIDGPAALRAVDLNGDGLRDLVAAENVITVYPDPLPPEYSNTIVIFFNRGDRTFGGETRLTVGDLPQSVAVGDLDRDGDQDLAVGNGASDTISILLNRGDGTFAPAVGLAAGDLPRSVTAGDLDRDGDLDLLAANPRFNTISVLQNTTPVDFLEGAHAVTLGTDREVTGLDFGTVRSAAAARFVRSDSATQGYWFGVYGAQGYTIVGAATNLPAYATVSPSGHSPYTWASSTADARALRKAPGTTDRIAATWYAASSFTIDLDLTDGRAHRVSLYALDWDGGNSRRGRIEVIDPGTGTVLDTRTLAAFSNGVYMTWELQGLVQVRVTHLAGGNAVLSGLFFDDAPASARFVGSDSTTQGNWPGVYGTQGYHVIGGGASPPAFAAVAPSGQTSFTWAASTAVTRAPRKAPDATDRIAATWYSPTTFAIDLDLVDGQPRRVTAFALDWDGLGRVERLDIVDPATGAVLDSRTISAFSNGVYLSWALQGRVRLLVTNLSGSNAVLSGLFFDDATAAAHFTGGDVATRGNWFGTYGGQGYNIIGASAVYPSYAAVTSSGQASFTWAASTADVRALRKTPGSVDRVAATWYAASSFTIDLNLADGLAHRVTAYALDWDGLGRVERLEVIDPATGSVLDARTIAGFSGGLYLTWELRGHVQVRVTRLAGANAVLSGLFLDAATTSARPVGGGDAATQGNWIGAYGAQGYNVIGAGASYPSYAVVNSSGQAGFTWAASTTDPRALRRPGGTGRIAGTWYSPSSFTIDLNLTDGQAHRVSLYALDWDGSNSRSQRLEVIDPISGAVLDTRTLSAFSNGVYLTWELRGRVQVRVTRLAGLNAVLSGLFFDAAPTSARFVGGDATTQGNWIGAYGAQGYNVIGSGVSYPSYAAVTPSGQAGFTWAAGTADARALRKTLGSTDRIAATWYAPTSFTIDLNLTDGQAHRVSLYALDWDGLGRVERLEVIDPATGAVLDTRTIAAFSGGLYLTWELRGRVLVRVTRLAGANAVLSGLFLDAATS